MTETTPTLLAARETLAVERACEVMHGAYESAAAEQGWETQAVSRKPWADVPEANKATMRAAVTALIDFWLASGVVRDVGTLAADETLVEAVAQAFNGGPLGIVDPGYWEHMPGRLRDQYRITTRHALIALAAALGGDRPAPTTEEQS